MTALVISLAILLAVPILAFALVFAAGALGGIAAYHMARVTVVQYQPMRKAFDPTKEKTQAVAVARKLAQESADIAKGYLGGIQMTREQFLAGENGK